MGKRSHPETLGSGPRSKREDPEKAERIRQMRLKDLGKIIGSWVVGSEATKRSEPDTPSEVVIPKRFCESSQVNLPPQCSLIDLEPVVETELLFFPTPRKPYVEMATVKVPLGSSTSSSHVIAESSMNSPMVNDGDVTPPNPFVPNDLSSVSEPMQEGTTRVRHRRIRISGKQASTTGCYLVIVVVIWLIIRVLSGEFVTQSDIQTLSFFSMESGSTCQLRVHLLILEVVLLGVDIFDPEDNMAPPKLEVSSVEKSQPSLQNEVVEIKTEAVRDTVIEDRKPQRQWRLTTTPPPRMDRASSTTRSPIRLSTTLRPSSSSSKPSSPKTKEYLIRISMKNFWCLRLSIQKLCVSDIERSCVFLPYGGETPEIVESRYLAEPMSLRSHDQYQFDGVCRPFRTYESEGAFEDE